MKFSHKFSSMVLTVAALSFTLFASSCSLFSPEGEEASSAVTRPGNGSGSGSGSGGSGNGNGSPNGGAGNSDPSPSQGPVLDTGDPMGKRGLCFEKLNEAEIKVLASSDVTWVYNWGTHPSAKEDELFQKYGIEYIPMQWGRCTDRSIAELREYYTNHPDCKYLLGFNEPNLGAGVGGSGIPPADAARDWPKLEKIAEDFNLKLVGPALQYSGERLGDGKVYGTPKVWMDAFIEAYKNQNGGREPRYDYFCLHCYMNWPGAQEGYLKEYYNGVSAYNKPIWLTEFCAWEYNNGGQNESMAAQTSSMAEKVKFMDGYEGVARYAWFMSSQNTYTIPFNSLFVSVNSDGSLTSLGQSYLNLGNDTLLANALEESKKILEEAVEGSMPGQYPAEAIGAFRLVYENALAKKTSKDQAEVKAAFAELKKALSDFEESRIKVFVKSLDKLSSADFAGSLTKNLPESAFSASSENGDNKVLRAFDGNFETRWESAHADNQWVKVDFGSEVEFNTFRFEWEAAYPDVFCIQISNSGSDSDSDWTTIFEIDDCGGGSETYKMTLTQKARYVRFYGKTRITDYGHSFWEWGICKE